MTYDKDGIYLRPVMGARIHFDCEALRKYDLDEDLTFNVFNAVMDFSARIWGGKTKVNSDLFEQQIEIMTALYTVMREAHDKIRNV